MKLTDVISKRNVYGKDFYGEDIQANSAELNNNGSTPALEINQSGTGDGLVVNDGAIKLNDEDQTIARYSLDILDRPRLILSKARGNKLSPQIAINDDRCGSIDFEGYDGSQFLKAASITVLADTTPTSNSIPGRLVFSTTESGSSTPTSRIVIKSSGNVGINETDPQVQLHVGGNFRVDGDSTLDGGLRLDIGTATSATAGSATLPANPVGFIEVNINGTNRKIPYYAV